MTKSRKTGKVLAVVEAMERIAPTWAAEQWDNVGLLAGSEAWPARRILLTIDLTAAVLDEARRGKFDVIIAYHPPVFRPTRRMTVNRSEQAGLAAEALSDRIAIYSPHTALDAAPGGSNDTLAALCGLIETRPAAPVGAGRPQCKLVTFVPESHIEPVAEALFAAGAGLIGEYEKCSFQSRGEGTFFGLDSTNPAVGRRGRLERVEEIRLEVILPRRRLPDVTAALRQSHPYEEPAFDVYPLEPILDRRIGQGRIGRFPRPTTLANLARMLARKTRAVGVSMVGDPRQRLRRGIVWVGAAGSSPLDACKPCGPGDVVVTGELRHHDALQYERIGLAALNLGHWASERPALQPLAITLNKLLPDLKLAVSRADCDPLRPV